jgi:hypothetical protein
LVSVPNQCEPEGSPAPTPALLCREHAVAVQRTPLSGEEAAGRLERAYRSVLGKRPSHETLALLTAHWAHESNQGASMLNYNFGGIKGVGPTGAYVFSPTHEGVGERARRRTYRFRAYANANDGARDYVSLLQRLYGSALSAAMQGDIAGFVRELKAGGYFSGDAELYRQKLENFVGYAEQWGFTALGPRGISPKFKVASNTMRTPS